MKQIAYSLLSSFLLLAPAFGAGLINGDFETPAISPGPGYATYTVSPAGFGWTVASGEIDIVTTYFQPSSGAQSVDLNGYNTKGSIYQDFSFPTSGSWLIKFDFSANPAVGGIKSMRVDFGAAGGPLTSLGIFSADSSTNSLANMHWLTYALPVDADAALTYRLQFSSLVDFPTAQGPTLDNVRIQVVPEPATAALLLTGCISGIFVIRKRRL